MRIPDVLAVPYDTNRYRNDVVNNLRVSSRPKPGHESYFTTPEQRKEIQEITEVLIQMTPTMKADSAPQARILHVFS